MPERYRPSVEPRATSTVGRMPDADGRSKVDAYNQSVYERDAVVREFTEMRELFPCEEHLFGRYLSDGARVLDLGVGAGRTSGVLAASASVYVALDYSEAMVRNCRERHPTVDVRLGDAAELGAFVAGSFDLVVFSYNGLDYLHPAAKRDRCLEEIARVLDTDGVLVVSTHNARALARPVPRHGTGFAAGAKALAVQAYATLRLWWHALPSRTTWRGEGYVRDSASANVMYAVSPARFEDALERHGLRPLERVASRYPEQHSWWVEPWYYVAARKQPS
jgi:SAM-dependent methyltransferase